MQQHAKVSMGEAAFGSVGASYSDLVTLTRADYIEVRSTLNQRAVLQLVNLAGEETELVIYANDPSTRIYDLKHQTKVRVKHAGVAPTSGTIIVQSIFAGL
jgi:hypothetical protein